MTASRPAPPRSTAGRGFLACSVSLLLGLSSFFLVPCSSVQAATTQSAQQPDSWSPATVVQGIPYQSVNELCNFYKLDSGVRPSQKGTLALGNTDISLELGPGPLSMRLGGIPLSLSHPLARDSRGSLLISRLDWVMWLDPILRPTYIEHREPISTVIIDAGHGGRDSGSSFEGSSEKEVTLLVAQELRSRLEKAGFRVVLTRNGDFFVSDQQRVDTAREVPQAIFLSLHVNSADPAARGPEVYRLAPPEDAAHPAPGNAEDARNAALSYALESALSSAAERVGAGCCYAHYSLLSSLRIPAVWVELGYGSHPLEAKLLVSQEYRGKLADALVRGITAFARATHPQTHFTVTPPISQPKPPQKPAANNKTSPAKKATRSSDSSGSSRSRRRRRN